jgi:hypothetical protein
MDDDGFPVMNIQLEQAWRTEQSAGGIGRSGVYDGRAATTVPRFETREVTKAF